MSDPSPVLPKQGCLHVLSWWSLGLTMAGAVCFTVGFVIAANTSQQAMDKTWVGSLCIGLTFIAAPLCVLSACLTGAMGVKKRGTCLSGLILLVPLAVIAVMMLITWIGLVGAARFR